MLTSFPVFTKLNLSHRSEVHEFVHRFPPYSDFNFLSILSWATRQPAEASVINDNLLLRITDYRTGAPLFTLLGITDLPSTLRVVFDFLSSIGAQPTLRLVPEETVQAIDGPCKRALDVRLDNESCDYVYRVSDLANLPSSSLLKKRRSVEKCRNRYQGCQVTTIDITNPDIAAGVVQVFDRWQQFRSRTDEEVSAERGAIEQCLALAPYFNIVSTGAFNHGRLVGWTINELVHQEYYMAHFGKAHPEYRGLVDLLEHETAIVMLSLGTKLMNFQQDLGLPGLRSAKRSWQPHAFLNKFILEECP